ncbi:hypothetical protein D3C74_428430 [compost metagenome]
MVLAYNRKIPTIPINNTEDAPMAAAPFVEAATSSMEGSYCNVTKEKYKATLNTSANT